MKIELRKPTDRGGYACMPLVKNIKVPHRDWVPTTCPECGQGCYETPLLKVAIATGAEPLCTECALRKGIFK